MILLYEVVNIEVCRPNLRLLLGEVVHSAHINSRFVFDNAIKSTYGMPYYIDYRLFMDPHIY